MTPEECAAALAGVEPQKLEEALAGVLAEILDWTSNAENAAELFAVAFAGAGRPHVVVEALDAARISIHDQRAEGLYGEITWTASPLPEDDETTDAWIVTEPGGLELRDLAGIGR